MLVATPTVGPEIWRRTPCADLLQDQRAGSRAASSVLCHTGTDPLGLGRLVSEAEGKGSRLPGKVSEAETPAVTLSLCSSARSALGALLGRFLSTGRGRDQEAGAVMTALGQSLVGFQAPGSSPAAGPLPCPPNL